MEVGLAIKAAIARGKHYERLCARQLRVRLMTVFGDYDAGLTITANIAARDQEELENGRCSVRVPWEELDERADELVGLVDHCVAEVEVRFGLRRAA